MQLVKSFRLKVCMLACLLFFVNFQIAGIALPPIFLLYTFFIAVTIMLQNDWRDRVHDAQKNKRFVLENLDLFLTVLLIFWTISVVSVLFIFKTNILAGFFFLFILIVGLLYSEVRRIPLASTILVALSSSSLPLFLMKGAGVAWLIFIATFLFIFGREVMKDIDDLLIDKGYKWTLAGKFGEEKAKIIAMACIFTAIIITTGTLLILFPNNFFPLLGIIVITTGIGFFGIGMPSKTARTWLDAGVFLSILGLIIV